jgi:major membrane immunogen (membrane-anchored lipoprotein)
VKKYQSVWLVCLLILLTGCSSRVSTHHRNDGHAYRHHNHVSVGVHTRTSGAGVLGVLIVGGIINSIIHQQQHLQDHEDSIEGSPDIDTSAELRDTDGTQQTSAEDLTNGYSIDLPNNNTSSAQVSELNGTDKNVGTEYQKTKQQQSKNVEWYQVGKDGKCYLMAVNNGVTDIISAVPDSSCN